MKRIDEYIENIYKDFDEKDEETKILKEEMKFHLYDEVNDLIKEGYSEEQSIQLAVSHFGDENNVSNEMKSIITKQTKYTNILLKLSIIVLIIGLLSKLGGWYYEQQYMDKWQKNRAVTSSDIINSLERTLNERKELSENDKKIFDKILDDYNDKFNNGLYSVRILKNDVTYYEYNRNVSSDLILNGGGGISGNNNGWRIESKHTDTDQYRGAVVWNQLSNIKYISNTAHFRLNNLGFWLISLSWVLISMFYTQRSILVGKLSRNKIIILSLQTIAIFATFTSDKDIILPTVILFMLCNALYPMIVHRLHKKRELLV